MKKYILRNKKDEIYAIAFTKDISNLKKYHSEWYDIEEDEEATFLIFFTTLIINFIQQKIDKICQIYCWMLITTTIIYAWLGVLAVYDIKLVSNIEYIKRSIFIFEFIFILGLVYIHTLYYKIKYSNLMFIKLMKRILVSIMTFSCAIMILPYKNSTMFELLFYFFCLSCPFGFIIQLCYSLYKCYKDCCIIKK